MYIDIENLKIEFLKIYQYDKNFFFKEKIWKLNAFLMEGFSDDYH